MIDVKIPMMVPEISSGPLSTSDLPAIRLHKINSKFEKHLNMQYNRIVD